MNVGFMSSRDSIAACGEAGRGGVYAGGGAGGRGEMFVVSVVEVSYDDELGLLFSLLLRRVAVDCSGGGLF